MPFSQKLELMSDLRALAWNLKMARIRSQHPEWTEAQIQDEVRKIFLHGST